MHIRVVFNQTDLNVCKHSVCFIIGAGRSLTAFHLSHTHPCKTLEDIEKACLRCFLNRSVYLLVVKRFCMVNVIYKLILISAFGPPVFKMCKKYELLCCSKFDVTEIYHHVDKLIKLHLYKIF